MENIYNSLRTVFQNLIKENKNNSAFIPAILVLLSIPMPYVFNNIALGLFFLITIITFKKTNFSFQPNLVLPLLLYLLMATSVLWTIDKDITLSALLKEVPLFLIPTSFLISKNFSVIQKQKIFSYYSYSIVLLVVYYSLRAIVRYAVTKDSRVFFYHGENEDDYGLVPKLLNAIHVSVFVAVAFFYFFTKKIKQLKNQK